jgi:hypothetical protein
VIRKKNVTDTAFTDDQACASGGGGGKDNGFWNKVELDRKGWSPYSEHIKGLAACRPLT